MCDPPNQVSYGKLVTRTSCCFSGNRVFREVNLQLGDSVTQDGGRKWEKEALGGANLFMRLVEAGWVASQDWWGRAGASGNETSGPGRSATGELDGC